MHNSGTNIIEIFQEIPDICYIAMFFKQYCGTLS